MIQGNVRSTGGDAESAEILIVASATEGLEISDVFLFDRIGEEIFRESVPDCVSSYEQSLLVSQRRLPVSLTIRKCVSGTDYTFGPFVPPDPGIRPCDPAAALPPSAACRIGLSGANRLRDQVATRCADLAELEHLIEYTRWLVVLNLGLAAALLAGAAIAAFFGPLAAAFAAGLAGFAAIFAALAIVIGILLFERLTQRRNANIRLDEAKRDFLALGAEVRRQCCPHDINISLDSPC